MFFGKLPKKFSITPIKNLTVCRLYETNIVILDHDSNTITLDSGGYDTNHTKKCANLILNRFVYHLYQEDFQWYVTMKNGKKPAIFEDGMELAM